MPVFKAESTLVPGMSYDRRWRHWGKLIRSAADIDLTRQYGNALIGPFVKWGEACPVDEGQFLVLASETGTASHRHYEYGLLRCQKGELQPIDDATRHRYVEYVGIDLFTSAQLADALNSDLYEIACYAWLCLPRIEPADARQQGLARLTRDSDDAGLYSPVVARLGERVAALSRELADLRDEVATIRASLDRAINTY